MWSALVCHHAKESSPFSARAHSEKGQHGLAEFIYSFASYQVPPVIFLAAPFSVTFCNCHMRKITVIYELCSHEKLLQNELCLFCFDKDTKVSTYKLSFFFNYCISSK